MQPSALLGVAESSQEKQTGKTLMVRSCLPLTAALLILVSGCSDQAELKVAQERIAQLEAELAAVKARPAESSANQEPANINPDSKITEPSVDASSAGQQWIYDVREDKMTGGKTRSTYVFSSNTVSFGSPYSGAQHGQLTLRNDPKYGRDVIFSIERGQLLCRSYEDCNILVRFDDGKPETFSAIGPADNSSDTVFIRNYDRFLGKLRKAKTVRISLNVYKEGAPVFEFDVGGFDEAKHTGKK